MTNKSSNKQSRRSRRTSSYDQATGNKRRGSLLNSMVDAGKIFTYLLIFAFVLVGARLAYLQIIDASELSSKVESSHLRQNTIFAKRGTIYDRNGNVLAKSVDCKEIYADPSVIKYPDEYAKIFASFLGGDEADYKAKLTQKGTFVYIKRGLDVELVDKTIKYFKDHKLPGVESINNSKREYPYGSCAAQVLGLVNVDGEGISGIEKQYDSLLKGTNGESITEKGRNGLPIAGGKHIVKPAKDGTDIVLSLDVNVQQMAEDKIKKAVGDYKAESGSVVVTQPKTGEILAMCSTPFADFNDLSRLDAQALQLKPVSSSYEPGSTFKVLTMAIGLENQLINPHTEFTVPPKVKVGADMVGDDDKRNHTEVMDVTEILRRSSNTGAVMVSKVIGKTLFAEGVSNFGIGTKTGIDFPGESAGIVTPLSKYNGATMGAMSFGQSLAIPAIQMVRAFGAIANDGVINTPHFLIQKGGQEVTWPEGKRVVSKKTSDQLTEMMRQVILKGTGKPAQVEGLDIAGKTGTGEQADKNGTYRKDYFMASLIGYANADDPDVLIYVGVNGTPYLSTDSSAPAFGSIMKEAAVDLGMKNAK